MRLRVARKIDRGSWKRRKRDNRDKRVWWATYTDEQLCAAIRRLRRSWVTHRKSSVDSSGRRSWSLVPDWFASNRIESRLIRQVTIRNMRRPEKR